MTVAESLPLHALPGIRAVRNRGRPKKVAIAPGADARAYHAEIDDRRRDALEEDPLVRATDGDGDVLDAVILAVAREAAGLRWERERAQERGLETTSQISSRIIDAYGKLATLVLQRHALRRGEPSPAQMDAVREMFMQSIHEIVIDVMGVDAAGAFMSAVGARIAACGDGSGTP